MGVQGGPVCRWATVIENLEDLNVDEVISQFDVTREQVEAVLKFVAEICAPKSRPVLPCLTTVRRRDCPAAPVGHSVHTVQARGWDTLSNGDLLNGARRM